MVKPDEIMAMLGHKLKRGGYHSDDARAFVRAGMPAKVLDTLSHALHVSVREIQIIAGIPSATAARKRASNETLRPAFSDRLYRLAAVFTLAKHVLEDGDRAAQWFREPNRALHGERPLDLLDTEIGAREVELVLHRLEHGIYS